MKSQRKKTVVTAISSVSLMCVFALTVTAQNRTHIQATARGTSTQLGRIVNIDIRINQYSTAEDKTALRMAFEAGGSNGLVNALDKMKSKGRIAITGTLGYDLNYIRQFNLPDGRVLIRFVTDRPVTFGEAWNSTRSMDYAITLGEVIISKEKGKSTGTLMPATKVTLNKKGELELEAYQNPWQLMNIRY
jgi:hypothetical protein